jgi:Flp pilus assembly protein TadD
MLVLLVYSAALTHAFVNWDDNVYVYENSRILTLDWSFIRWAFSAVHFGAWHPLTWISHAIACAVWGLDPFGHHLVNVALHVLNTFLLGILSVSVYRLVVGDRSVGSVPQALAVPAIAGALFGLHPLGVEAVAWVTSRKDVLYATFFLLSLIAYVHHIRDARGRRVASLGFWYLLMSIFFVLALLSKPVALTLPFVLVLIDWLTGRLRAPSRFGAVLLEKIPLICLSAAGAFLMIWAHRQGGAAPDRPGLIELVSRAGTGAYLLVGYLKKLVWPVGLGPYTEFEVAATVPVGTMLVSSGVVVAITLVVLRWSRRAVAPAVAWLSYVTLLLPTLGLIRQGQQLMAERYTYLANAGLFLLVAVGVQCLLDRLLRRRVGRIAIVAVVGILMTFGGLLAARTRAQVDVWRDSVTLWRHAQRLAPGASLPYKNLGNALLEMGDLDGALAALQQGFELDPADGELIASLSDVLLRRGDAAGAVRVCRVGTQVAPANKAIRNNLAVALLDSGRLDEAELQARTALKIDASEPTALSTLGEIQLQRGDSRGAYRFFLEALRHGGESEVRLYNLASALEQLGDLGASCEYWDRYLKLVPGDERVRNHAASLGCR